ncbi:hypothetical protein [Paenibacillus contaminans]|uniref:Uncharacterized protein n=1 Tax=Paenibacillus contaminans TaxID=450362 RepID=A0A329MUG3_9BACL|nr:hypothetical protein [Paenibacillus contaminans]RAV22323.1 hypothetical protein DQG23_05080 [Paenibacillus contaminans]
MTSDSGMPFPQVKGQMYEHDFKLPLAVRWGDSVPAGLTDADERTDPEQQGCRGNDLQPC